MTADANVIMWAIGGAASIVVWAVRVEAKVQAHDRELAQMRTDLRAEMHEMKQDLKYIRERLDATR